MKTIYKYELQIADIQEIEMPLEGKVISAKEQEGKLIIWALIENNKPKRMKNIQVIGTGNPISYNLSPYDWDFIDTVLMSNGLVWHVFADRR